MHFHSNRQNRLARRLLLHIVICSAVFTLLTTAIQLFFEYRSDVGMIHSNMQLIEKSYIPNIALSIYLVEEEQLKVLLKGALQLKDIQYLEIQEKRGNKTTLTFEGKADSPRDIVKTYPLIYPVPSGGEVFFGNLSVVASLDGVYQRIWNKALIILATNAIKTFFASMCIFFIILLLITRHLKKISDYTHQFDLEEIDSPLILDRRKPAKIDEIEQVVLSINTMKARLKKDLVEKKKAKEKIQRSRESFFTVLESIPATVYVADMETYEIIFMNKFMIETYGRDMTGEICWRVFEENPGYVQTVPKIN